MAWIPHQEPDPYYFLNYFLLHNRYIKVIDCKGKTIDRGLFQAQPNQFCIFYFIHFMLYKFKIKQTKNHEKKIMTNLSNCKRHFPEAIAQASIPLKTLLSAGF